MPTKIHEETVEVPAEPAGANHYPPSLDALRAARRDYEDVKVDDLGMTLRLWALSGAARAAYMARLAGLAKYADMTLDEMQERPPSEIERVMLAQSYLVAGSLGYPVADWDAVAETLSEAIVDQLYPIAARLSKMQEGATQAEVESLKANPSASSGTD